jgi:hypothetical protein
VIRNNIPLLTGLIDEGRLSRLGGAMTLLEFPAKISVKAALAQTLRQYDQRREIVEISFRISNLNGKQLKKSLSHASSESVAALLELLSQDIEAHALIEMMIAVRGRVQSALIKP